MRPVGTARAGRSSNFTMRLLASGLIILACAGCSTSHTASGTIAGRYYVARGLPHPVAEQPVSAPIAIDNVATHRIEQAFSDSHGYFKLVVPPGTYDIYGRSRHALITKTVIVAPGATTEADLGATLVETP